MNEKWKEFIRKTLSKKYVANLVVILVMAIMILIMFGNNSKTDTPTEKKQAI